MFINHMILGFVWIIYCVLHSVLASISVKKMLQQKLKSNYKYYRIFYTVFAFLFLIVLIWFQISIETIVLYRVTFPILVFGSVISFSGLVLMLICIKKYFISLSGLKSLFQEKVSNTLIITGVHGYVRHPLYLGTFAFIWGLFIMFPYLSLLISNFVITIYTLIGIRFEEEKLVNEFGENYRRYQETVPKLIPFSKPLQVRRSTPF